MPAAPTDHHANKDEDLESVASIVTRDALAGCIIVSGLDEFIYSESVALRKIAALLYISIVAI